jgi:hypothetical protein
MPAALTDFLGGTGMKTRIDLTSASQVRLVTYQGAVGATNAKLKIQYSTDQSAWNDLCVVAVGAGATQVKSGAWTAVPAGAKSDVFLRLMGIDGDAAADPAFGMITLQVK